MKTPTDRATAACTISGSTAFGSTCRSSTRAREAPPTRAASAYSRSRWTRIPDRNCRPNKGISASAMTMNTGQRPGPSTAVTASARISPGKASTRSKARWTAVSAQRWVAESRASEQPASAPTGTAERISARSVVMPCRTRLKRSRPRSSVPNGCAALGPASASGPWASGSWPVSSGASSPARATVPTRASPVSPRPVNSPAR